MVRKCDDTIHEALGRVATDRELGAIYRKAADLKAKVDRVKNDPLAVRNILKDFTEEQARMKADARRNAALNYVTTKNLSDFRAEAETTVKNPAEVLRSMTGGSLLDFKGSRDHVLSHINRAVLARQGAFWTDLEAKNVATYAHDPAAQRAIGNAKWDLQHGEDPASLVAKHGKQAVDVAQAMIRHEMSVINQLNQYGATIGKNPKNIVSRALDGNKVAKAGGAKWGEGFDAWKQDVEKMDWQQSFDGKYADAEPAARDKLLKSLYSQFLSGKHLRWGDSQMPGRGLSNVGKRRSYSREIVFNNADDEIGYLMKYGKGNSLAEQLDHWMQGGERDAQIMRKFGPNPIQNWDAMVDKWAKELNDRGDVKGYDALMKANAYQKAVMWPAILDETAHPNANIAAKVLMASRGSFITAAKIGMSVISSLAGDPVARAATMRYYGNRSTMGLFSNYGKSALAMFKGLSREDQMNLAADAGVRFQDIHRPMGLTPEDEFGLGGAARVAQHAMKWMGHSWMENRFHSNWLAADGASDARMGSKGFEKLPEGFQAGLRQFGIDAKGWEVMRKMETSDIGGAKIFQADNIRRMDLQNFKSLVDDAEPSDVQLTKARDLLADRYRNFLGDRSVSATSDPDLGLRAQVMAGTQRGTLGGEAWRSVLMLKTWGIKYMRNTLGRELYGYGQDKPSLPKALWQTLRGDNGGHGRSGLAGIITLGIVAGYMRNAMYDIASGKTPEDVFDPKNAGHAFQRAFAFQALGLLTDFVFEEARRNSDKQIDASDRIIGLMGPAVENYARLFDLANDTAHQLAEGKFNTKNQNKDLLNAFNLIYRNVPGNNAFWSKYALDTLVVNNLGEALNPGYKKRLTDRAKEHGQTYLMGP